MDAWPDYAPAPHAQAVTWAILLWHRLAQQGLPSVAYVLAAQAISPLVEPGELTRAALGPALTWGAARPLPMVASLLDVAEPGSQEGILYYTVLPEIAFGLVGPEQAERAVAALNEAGVELCGSELVLRDHSVGAPQPVEQVEERSLPSERGEGGRATTSLAWTTRDFEGRFSMSDEQRECIFWRRIAPEFDGSVAFAIGDGVARHAQIVRPVDRIYRLSLPSALRDFDSATLAPSISIAPLTIDI